MTFNNAPTTSTSGLRTFITPPIEPNRVSQYNLQATVQREGRALTSIRKIRVRAGQEIRITLDFPVASVARR